MKCIVDFTKNNYDFYKFSYFYEKTKSTIEEYIIFSNQEINLDYSNIKYYNPNKLDDYVNNMTESFILTDCSFYFNYTLDELFESDENTIYRFVTEEDNFLRISFDNDGKNVVVSPSSTWSTPNLFFIKKLEKFSKSYGELININYFETKYYFGVFSIDNHELPLNVKEVQNLEYEILLFFDDFCKKNSIEYFLDSGTMLGAVRHSGFIPWDDDIDVGMTYPNYVKFLEKFKGNERYKLFKFGINEDYYCSFPKIVDLYSSAKEFNNISPKNYGAYIDIFVYSGFPYNRLKKELYYYKLKFYATISGMIKLEQPKIKKGFFNKIIYKIFYKYSKRLNKVKFYNKFIKYSIKYCDITDNVAETQFVNNKNSVFGDIFNNLILHEFNNHMFPIPAQYDLYLSKMYGNYLDIPPLDKQYSHGLKVYKKL